MSRPTPTRRPGHPASPFALDTLEPRLALANVTWDSGGGDNLWSNPLNWSGDVLPGPDDDVDLYDAANSSGTLAPGLVIADAGPININSLTIRRSFVLNPGAEMNIAGTMLTDDSPFLGQIRINGDLDVSNAGASPTNPNVVLNTTVNPLGRLTLGAPQGPRTRIELLNIQNLGRIRLQNISASGTITNVQTAILDASDTGAIPYTFSTQDLPIDIINQGLLRVDNLAGPRTELNVSNFGTVRVTDAVLVAQSTGEVNGIFHADGQAALIQLHPFLGVGDTIDLHGVTLTGSGAIAIPFAQGRTIHAGNTVVNANLLIEAGMPIEVAGGRLTINGSLTQYGDDLVGDLTGTGQVIVNGTLSIGGFRRAISAPLIINQGGRLETWGALTILESGITSLGTLLRTTPGRTLIIGALDNRGSVDAEQGRIEVLGTPEQLVEIGPGEHALTGGEWIARNDAVISWPAGTTITTVGTGATLGFVGKDARIQGTESLETNRGRILLGGGREDFLSTPEAPASLLNYGTIRKVGGGTTTIAVPVDQRKLNSGAGAIEVRRGTLVLVGQEFINRGTLDVRSGRLVIDLGDEGQMVNTGSVVLGAAGRLKVEGSLDNRETGLIEAEIEVARSGRLLVADRLDLGAGTLRASFVGSGFEPGTVWRVMTAGERLGTFGTFTSSAVPGGLRAVPAYGQGVVRVRVVV